MAEWPEHPFQFDARASVPGEALFRRDNVILIYLAAVNRGIDTLFESGRMSQINQRWLGMAVDDGSG